MSKITITMDVNGQRHELAVEPGELLVDVLRETLGLTGTKKGCGEGECGACTVNMDGRAILSCLTLAVQADGRQIMTIEGLGKGTKLHPLQESFVNEAAIQCGFCSPGMIMASHALLKENQDPTEGFVRKKIANNLCRCTGYERPVKAILKAARMIKEENHE